MSCFSRVVHVGQARWGLPSEHASHSVINMGTQTHNLEAGRGHSVPVSRTRGEVGNSHSPTVRTTKDSETHGDDNHEQNVDNLTRDSDTLPR
jgi:hypothetical protein